MPDYGHPLRFGAFISPFNSPAQRPVELAQLGERLGYDFVTFQDHPYNSTLLDTWALLNWVAARTERIGVSGDELKLPLRQPVNMPLMDAWLQTHPTRTPRPTRRDRRSVPLPRRPRSHLHTGTSLVVDGGWEITGYPDLRRFAWNGPAPAR